MLVKVHEFIQVLLVSAFTNRKNIKNLSYFFRWADQCMPGHDHKRNVGKHLRAVTHIKRQVTQHVCLPSLLDDGDKIMEIVSGEEKILCSGPTRTTKTEQKSLVLTQQAQRTNQGRTPFSCTP
jgi:hypothetical protein